jgi:hypothetical protein
LWQLSQSFHSSSKLIWSSMEAYFVDCFGSLPWLNRIAHNDSKMSGIKENV